MASTTKSAYTDYYKGLNAPIGGNDRFTWISDVLLSDATNKTVLDIGCGEGTLLQMLRTKNNKVFGIDASESGRSSCKRKGIDCSLLDISTERFPFDDNMFDIVLCLETLEHVENPHHCIWEIKRILKEGGLCIASIPNPKILHPYIYPGLFTFKNFRAFLTANSFEVKEVRGWGQAVMLKGFISLLKKKDNFLCRGVSYFVNFIGRKRNLLMRKHTGTPFSCSHSFAFVCVNHKKDKTLVEQLAEETRPNP